jgi:hypothetical protein
MKRIILFSLIFLIISCKKKQESYVEKYTNSELDSIESIIGKISTKDTACLKEIDYAKQIIKKDSLIYNLYMTQMSYGRNLEEFQKLLKPYGIGCEILLTSCIGHGKGRSYCCTDYINQTIKNKFKKGFIDSLEIKADRIYLTKNINLVFQNMDEYDKTIFYPNAKSVQSQRDDVEKDFLSTFKFPKGFDYKHKRYIGRSSVKFILYRNGMFKDVIINTEFEQKTNNKFIPYFDNEIKKYVKQIKWIPRKQRGITVNGELGLWFTYKKLNN